MLTLTSGASSIVVSPEHGAGLTGWMLGRTSLLRRALPQASVGGDVHAMGCFPLLPYCNRIGQGRFRWRGTDYALARNFGEHPHPIHGVGWQRPWVVAETSPVSATLTLDHRPDHFWPFGFQTTVAYRLTGSALTVTIELTNWHATPAPAGIGLHPYFPRTNNPLLRFNATGVWKNGPNSLPLQHASPPAGRLHTEPRPVRESRLDNCFTGWDGSADIHAGPASLRIEASGAFRHAQVFTPSWADFFCVEPVSHAPNALNQPDLPADQAMHILQPGQTLRGTIRLIPTGTQCGESSIASAASDPARISTSRT